MTLFMTANANAYDVEELAYMKKFFSSIQQRTFDANREYCGHVGIDEKGDLITSIPKKGQEDSCTADQTPPDFLIIASYHTHGAFSIDADSEAPSTIDLQADIIEQMDGWIGTPGGRIWFNDNINQTATMACENCILKDPNFDGSQLDPVLKFYTLDQLKARDELNN